MSRIESEESAAVADDSMFRIESLIADLQAIHKQFGNTCVYIRRHGLSWGAVAMNYRSEDEANGVFDLQASHDRDMRQRYEQVQRLVASNHEWMQKVQTLDAEIESIRNENERLQNHVFVPGLWKCAKCDFRLAQSNLNAQTGAITARDDAGDKCPNCDGPLWRVSAMDDRNEAYKTANQTFEKLASAEKRLAAAERVVEAARTMSTASPQFGMLRDALAAFDSQGKET